MDILAVVVVLVVLVAGPMIVVNRDLLFNRSVARRIPVDEPLPFLIIPSYPGASEIVPAGAPRSRVPAAATPPARVPATVVRPPEPSPAPRENEQPERSSVMWEQRWEDSEEPAPDATIVFNRPVDQPVQILPGRLHVLSGDGAGEDFRLFSKIGEPPQIVVGREAGPPHRHITLHSPTVSRRHARMEFVNGDWTITNLSETNPVLVNDRVLNNGGSPRKLSNGDRIELGEVALRFLAS